MIGADGGYRSERAKPEPSWQHTEIKTEAQRSAFVVLPRISGSRCEMRDRTTVLNEEVQQGRGDIPTADNQSLKTMLNSRAVTYSRLFSDEKGEGMGGAGSYLFRSSNKESLQDAAGGQ